MVQISSRKSPYSPFEPLSNSFIFCGKSANAFKSATNREEICTIFDPVKGTKSFFMVFVPFFYCNSLFFR